ncbi:ABC transporter substrate-binding protein [Lonepinella sp. BR2357]|uniref:ABC transporter substrate-binding protein n=1 Tax=Lonepinella sp. BR2357 TaxID=3434549 RepID=UPI003F6DFF10
MKKTRQFYTALFSLTFALSAQANEKLTMLIDWFVNPVHADIVIAKQKGFFEQQGLDVEIIEPTDPSMPPKLVAAGQADISMDFQPQLIMHVDQGLPLMRIGTMVATPFTSLVVLKDSGINSLADLKGKKIGYSVSGFEDTILSSMLESAGLSLKDVQLINVNFALSQSLLSKQVDAVIGAYRNFELHELALEGHPAQAFFPEQNGVPSFEELTLVVKKGRETDPKIAKFLTALEQATVYMKQNPEQAWQDFVSFKPKELDNELNRLAWNDTYPAFADNPRELNKDRYNKVAEFMLQKGLIKTLPALESYTTEVPR